MFRKKRFQVNNRMFCDSEIAEQLILKDKNYMRNNFSLRIYSFFGNLLSTSLYKIPKKFITYLTCGNFYTRQRGNRFFFR